MASKKKNTRTSTKPATKPNRRSHGLARYTMTITPAATVPGYRTRVLVDGVEVAADHRPLALEAALDSARSIFTKLSSEVAS